MRRNNVQMFSVGNSHTVYQGETSMVTKWEYAYKIMGMNRNTCLSKALKCHSSGKPERLLCIGKNGPVVGTGYFQIDLYLVQNDQ